MKKPDLQVLLENTFRAIAMGDILCNTIEEKNSFKVRMLKAGLGDAVCFPDDWDSLPELEKASRLNLIMEMLRRD